MATWDSTQNKLSANYRNLVQAQESTGTGNSSHISESLRALEFVKDINPIL
jgi:hypothetical protein